MIVGIDLGTTHSLIGFFGPQGPQLIPNALGETLTPSVVAVDAERNLLVGRAARDRVLLDPTCGAATFKRFMGTDKRVPVGNQFYRAEELSAMVLRSLIADAEAHLGARVEEAVISVPAYFNDSQRKATRTAGELAGLRVERLVNEPTAAALAYGLLERKEESTFLVFDLGGGTFDVSILETFDGVMQVHSTCGDNYLGGEDFLDAMVQDVYSQWGLQRSGISAPLQAQLTARIERAKRELSGAPTATVEMNIDGKKYSWLIDEARFARIADPLLQRLRQPIERALRDARLDPEQLDEVVLVGGASRMPMVPRLVARILGRLPLRHVNPDEAIALGAAVAAGMKAREQSLEEIILTDVSPYTLGVATDRIDEDGRHVSGFFSPLIERNSTVPVSRVERFWPLLDMQTALQLDIYQGESPMVLNNIRLGTLDLRLPAKPKGENPVDVRFTYDVNGVLQVEATVVATGELYELILQRNPGTMSKREITERFQALASLKIHPRDQQVNLALLARADRIYAEHLGNVRHLVQESLARFQSALESQDESVVSQARIQFAEYLDQIESQLN